MITTRTPFRISFLGGGTDYPDWFLTHGGQTLGATIDKYVYVSVHSLSSLYPYRFRVEYSKTECVNQIEEIEHPAIRVCLQYVGIKDPLQISIFNDLPGQTGLGTSSALVVGLLLALYRFQGITATPAALAHDAVHVEQTLMRERVGVQDQHLCAHGGFCHVICSPGSSIFTLPVNGRPGFLSELRSWCLLLYTGIRRHASEVLVDQIKRTQEGALTPALTEMSRLVDTALNMLGRGYLSDASAVRSFGELIGTAWEIKKTFWSGLSPTPVDHAYLAAKTAGALGGKLLGAGGGGFLLLIVPPGKQSDVLRAVSPLQPIDFQFVPNGTEVVLDTAPEQTFSF